MISPRMLPLIQRVTSAMDQQGLLYAVTGSLASSTHGEPVSSIDVDVVVRMTTQQAARLARSLSPEFYADEQMLRSAAELHGMANVVDNRSGFKADISVVPDDAYYDQVLKRRVCMLPIGEGRFTWVVSAEDVVLMKLLWRKDTGSAKQWENALGVVRVQGARLDWAYLRRWATELGIHDDLDRLALEAGI
jgi:hypothetical protein